MNPDKFYDGSPCMICNETLRLKSNRGCYACALKRCHTPRQRAQTKEWQEANMEELKERARATNDKSRKTAINSGKEWTGPEMEIATREDLTLKEAADMLGRSIQSVHMMRHRCAYEPKYRDKITGREYKQ